MAHDDDDLDLEEEELGRLIHEAIRLSRGYADYLEYAPNRKLAEHGAASVLSRFLHGDDAIHHLAFPSQRDPPDLVLDIEGRRIGIDVTQIVDVDAVQVARRMKKGTHGWTVAELMEIEWPSVEWLDDRLARAVGKIVAKKDHDIRACAAAYDEIYIAVTFDEPGVDFDQARRVIDDLELETAHADRAFLLMSYQPGPEFEHYPDGCPVIEAKLRRALPAT